MGRLNHLALLALFVGLMLASTSAGQNAKAEKPVVVTTDDLLKLDSPDTEKAEKEKISAKYNNNVVRVTGTAKGSVAVLTGSGYVVWTDGKKPGRAIILLAKGEDFKKVNDVGTMKNTAAYIVVEGKGKFPGDYGPAMIHDAKLISIKAVPAK